MANKGLFVAILIITCSVVIGTLIGVIGVMVIYDLTDEECKTIGDITTEDVTDQDIYNMSKSMVEDDMCISMKFSIDNVGFDQTMITFIDRFTMVHRYTKRVAEKVFASLYGQCFEKFGRLKNEKAMP